MTFRGRVFDILYELACGTSRLRKSAIRRREREKKRQAELLNARNATRDRHAAWPWPRPYERVQDDEQPARAGLGSRNNARRWGENTGTLLRNYPRDCGLPAKPAPVRQASGRVRPTPMAATSGMSPETVREVISILGRILEHVPYAICGQAAMVHYGNEYHEPAHVSILVPHASREVVRCWAVAQGMNTLPGQCFAVATKDGLLRTVKVKIVKDGNFESLDTVKASRTQARLMTLPGLATQVAAAYVRDLKSNTSDRRQQGFARDMRWILRRIAMLRVNEHWLTPVTAKELLKADFWLPFTSSFPDTVLMFSNAGLEVDDDGSLKDDGCYRGQLSPRRGGDFTGSLWAY